MSFIDKGNIRIFPSSNRGVDSGQFGNNFATEYNLSSIVNKLLSQYIGGKNGFLISSYPEDDDVVIKKLPPDLSEESADVGPHGAQPAEFNIAGYFIEVSSWKDLVIVASQNTSEPESPEVAGSDTDSSFVQFYKDSNGIHAIIFLYDEEAADKSYVYMEGNDGGDTSGSSTEHIGEENGTAHKAVTLQLLEKYSGSDGEGYKLCQGSKLSFTNFRLDDGDLDSTPFKS